jgi:HAMP domain-containing protein
MEAGGEGHSDRQTGRGNGEGVGAGALGALLLGLLFARRITRPISALTAGVARVAGGDLSQELPVRSRDEVGQLTRAFNEMTQGLRQRDFIRNAFGRYVSPEVAKTIRPDSIGSIVLALGLRHLETRLDQPLAPLTNVRLRLTYPGLGHDSGDLYGKVMGDAARGGERLTSIRLTSVGLVAQKVIETLREG